MHDPPANAWAIIIAGPTAIAATTWITLYGGAKRAGQGRRRAALLAGATAGLLGGWFTASTVIAGNRAPWLPNGVPGDCGADPARRVAALGKRSRAVHPGARLRRRTCAGRSRKVIRDG